ncbi:unnamed protein product [Clavelina lepadiformis]|uniref:Uncharacterized protein n=1 Tax=Clavelina lepadiformis TaxID=159417 RepID=A0ABP0H014_CLALP
MGCSNTKQVETAESQKVENQSTEKLAETASNDVSPSGGATSGEVQDTSDGEKDVTVSPVDEVVDGQTPEPTANEAGNSPEDAGATTAETEITHWLTQERASPFNFLPTAGRVGVVIRISCNRGCHQSRLKNKDNQETR